MSEWKYTKLGDLIKIKSGFSYKGEFIGKGDAFLLGMGCVSFNKKFLNSGARKYSGTFSDSFTVKPGDIVLATRQQSDNLPILGFPAILPTEFENKKVVVGTNLYRVENCSEISNEFLFWLLKSPDYQRHILSSAKGTTVKMITKDAVESYGFKCPPEKERNFISQTLNDIDDKIELNNKINQELETLAQTLFKHWFIDFEFPNENGEPYKSTGGEMVDSELGEIPKGWRVGGIYDISSVIYGAPFKSSLFNQEKKGYPLIRIRDLKTFKPQNWTEEIHSKGTKIKPGDLVVGMDAEFRPHFWLGEEGWLNQRVCLFKPKGEFSRLFVREIIRPYLEFFENSSVGTTVIHLGKGDIDTFKSIIPYIHLSKLFTELTEPLINKIIENSKENESLRNIRDTLLPKLISGELEINEISN
jgi:type I restriction enzyme, S subunit